MFKIGDFARLSGVTAKQLRHYDGLGLFRPVWVDPASGYRFYSPAQLPELYRIVTLKDLGVPLNEIARLVEEGTNLAAVLRRRRAELVAEREELERRLRTLDIRVDLDAATPRADVVIRRLEPELVAGLRVRLDPGDDLEPTFNELEAYVRDTGARAARPPVTVAHRWDEDGSRDVEATVPLRRRIAASDRITCRRLERTRAAALIHRGPYSGLPDARAVLAGWIHRAELRPAGALRIVYLQFGADPHLEVPRPFLAESARDFVTELQQPIAG